MKCMSLSSSGFNPRPREGGDITAQMRGYLNARVSIHAPAKGATRRIVPAVRILPSFNPRPREGGD